jgi:hypothetical protein
VQRDKSVFEILSTTDFSKNISELQVGGKKLSYLSWSEAWTEVMIIYPDTTYEVVLDEETSLFAFISSFNFSIFAFLISALCFSLSFSFFSPSFSFFSSSILSCLAI